MKWLGKIVGCLLLAASASALATTQESPQCRITLSGQTFELNKKFTLGPETLAEVFAFLSKLTTWRALDQDVFELVRTGKIDLRDLTALGAGKTRLDDPASAFDFLNGKPTIFLGGEEFGVVASHLLHESVHAADEGYRENHAQWRPWALDLAERFQGLIRGTLEWDEWQESAQGVEKFRHQMVFQAERRALDAQYQFVQELTQVFPCAEAYFAYQGAQGRLVADAFTDAEIVELYQLRPEWVDAI